MCKFLHCETRFYWLIRYSIQEIQLKFMCVGEKSRKIEKIPLFLQRDFVWQHKNFEVPPCMTVIQKKSRILHE